MRMFVMILMMFLISFVVIAGTAMIPLADPASTIKVADVLGYVIAGSAVLSLIVSVVMAKVLMGRAGKA